MRSLILGVYFYWLPTPGSTLVFAALMGFTWLGVVPLVAGAVAEMFGLRWQAMIQGIAFVGHQVGSFVGAFGGGNFHRRARLLRSCLARRGGDRTYRRRGADRLGADAADPPARRARAGREQCSRAGQPARCFFRALAMRAAAAR